ncbi:MAG TPA: glycosyltransferase [Acidobacteriaceae bacterium]|nr:glycosyltransferase [Acidobacteriaceae bacterium]
MHRVEVGIAGTVLAWGIAAAWVYRFVEAAWGLRRVPNLLEAEYDDEPVGLPGVVVIVPARDEAAKVGECLESLLAQDYGNLRIVAVDDRSSDGTGEIMVAAAGQSGGRLEVLRVDELPAGWLGKTHAMALAARGAIAGGGVEYLLFTDADILFRPDAVRRTLVMAEAQRADHCVVLPTTIAKTRGEGMLLAYLQVMSLWAVRPWRVADPKAMRDAVGVGAFNMMRVDAYGRLGGFEGLRMEVVEDLELGRAVKRAGLRQRVATAPGMVSVHWAAGAGGIVAGMTKNLFAVFRFRVALVVAAAVWIAVFCLGPVAMLGIDEVRWSGVVAVGAVVGLYVFSARTSGISWRYAAGFPVAAFVVVYSMFRSMVVALVQGGVTWRGTFYRLMELREYAKGRRE